MGRKKKRVVDIDRVGSDIRWGSWQMDTVVKKLRASGCDVEVLSHERAKVNGKVMNRARMENMARSLGKFNSGLAVALAGLK